jgi:Domain of unknown function (DUF4286)
MIIYNITTKVHTSVDAAWLHWQQHEHTPETMATGFFTSHKLFRLLEQDDSDGNTYAIQYTAITKEHYNLYMIEHAQLLRQKALEKWGDKTISFRSVLEVIQ